MVQAHMPYHQTYWPQKSSMFYLKTASGLAGSAFFPAHLTWLRKERKGSWARNTIFTHMEQGWLWFFTKSHCMCIPLPTIPPFLVSLCPFYCSVCAFSFHPPSLFLPCFRKFRVEYFPANGFFWTFFCQILLKLLVEQN